MSEPQDMSGLMYQIHELKTLIADAEKRGAVKALRTEVQRFRDSAVDPSSPRSLHAQELEERADRIESGQVTLP